MREKSRSLDLRMVVFYWRVLLDWTRITRALRSRNYGLVKEWVMQIGDRYSDISYNIPKLFLTGRISVIVVRRWKSDVRDMLWKAQFARQSSLYQQHCKLQCWLLANLAVKVRFYETLSANQLSRTHKRLRGIGFYY